jgi:hypothetical protein
MKLKVSTRGGFAVAIALVAVIVSGVVGTLAETAPGELACRFARDASGESAHVYPTAIQAAAAFAADLLHTERRSIESNGGVIDVTGSDTRVGEIFEGGKLYAVRDHGRTLALLIVLRGTGGWEVTRSYVC